MDYQQLMRLHPHLFSNEGAILKIITDATTINTWSEHQRKALADDNLPPDWADIGVIYWDPYVMIVRDLVEFPSGNLGSYIRLMNVADLDGGSATAILPLSEERILLLHQFRHSTRSWHWEIPRGFGEAELSAEENAKKEIMEEIGGEISELIDLGGYHSNTGIEGVNVQLFLAKIATLGQPNPDEGIDRYEIFPVENVEKMIKDATITDGFTISAFTRARLRKLV